MAEYSEKIIKMIDYNAMKKAFDEKFKETMKLIQSGETHLDNLAEGFHEADGVIFRMPTIDAVPVVHGHWVNVQDFGVDSCYGYCSNCKTMHRATNPTALKMEYRHCRWCGAKMDGDQ